MDRSSLGVSQWAKSLRRNQAQVVSMEQGQEQDLHELHLFHSNLADKLLSLLPSPSADHRRRPHFISLSSISKLLDVVLACADEFDSLFSLISSRSPAVVSKPPLDRAVNDLMDRCVKSLDVCNCASLSIDSLRHWRRHADIAVAALVPPQRHAGQVKRARKALFKLLAFLPPDPHDTGGSVDRASRAWSFGRGSGGGKESPQGRGLSWSDWKSWSSSPRQVQAIWAGLSAQRAISCGGGGDAGGGLATALALAVYAMNAVLVLAMSALASAFPSHEYYNTTGPPPPPPPRQLPWATAMAWLQDWVAEEWKMSNAGGRTAGSTLAEVQAMARCARGIIDGLGEDTGTATTSATTLNLVAALPAELGEVCGRVEDEIGPLERKVREVFRRFVETRAEVQKCLQRCAS